MASGSSQDLEGGDMYFVAEWQGRLQIAGLSYSPLLVGFASLKASWTEDVLIGA